MEPLISVIIPVYNVEKYINKCVDSVLAQTYKNLEIILVNDGSPDNSPEICDKYAHAYDNVKVIHKENGGLSDARNAGIELATGEYICFIDSDDWVEPNYASRLYDVLVENNADFSCCGRTTTKNYTDKSRVANETVKVYSQEEFLLQCYTNNQIDVSAVNKLYKKGLFETIKYPVGKLYEDIVTIYELVKKSTRISVTNKKLYNIFQSEKSITRSGFKARDWDLIDQWEKTYNNAIQDYDRLEEVVFKKKVEAYLSLSNKIASTESEVEWKHIERIQLFFTDNHKKIKKNIYISKIYKISICFFGKTPKIYCFVFTLRNAFRV